MLNDYAIGAVAARLVKGSMPAEPQVLYLAWMICQLFSP